VLVAEDDADIRGLLVWALAGPDRRFVVAQDGQAALNAWSKRGFTLLILDLVMPERTGLEIVRHIRSAGDATPVILLSVTLNEAIRQEAKALGAVTCVEKPFILEDLRDAVDLALGHVSSRLNDR
jgi:CheY-like chemotaxis protein